MARGGNRAQVRLQSTESHHFYYTTKNKRNTPDRMTRRKYDPVLRKHVTYRETR